MAIGGDTINGYNIQADEREGDERSSCIGDHLSSLMGKLSDEDCSVPDTCDDPLRYYEVTSEHQLCYILQTIVCPPGERHTPMTIKSARMGLPAPNINSRIGIKY